MDIFQKAFDFTRADDVKKAGYYPYFRAIEANEGPVVRMEGKDVIMAGSNNYLGLTRDPRVINAALDAVSGWRGKYSDCIDIVLIIAISNQRTSCCPIRPAAAPSG